MCRKNVIVRTFERNRLLSNYLECHARFIVKAWLPVTKQETSGLSIQLCLGGGTKSFYKAKTKFTVHFQMSRKQIVESWLSSAHLIEKVRVPSMFGVCFQNIERLEIFTSLSWGQGSKTLCDSSDSVRIQFFLTKWNCFFPRDVFVVIVIFHAIKTIFSHPLFYQCLFSFHRKIAYLSV